jgi:hypothetical protein
MSIADNIFADIISSFNLFVSSSVQDKTGRVLAKLKSRTPIDTGYARSRWVRGNPILRDQIIKIKSNRVTISNDAPYIGALNRGHSQQAPRYFVEQVLIEEGLSADGVITKRGS